MKNYKLLSAILKGPWMINPDVAELYVPLINSLLSGKTPKGYEEPKDGHPKNEFPLLVLTLNEVQGQALPLLGSSKLKSYSDAPMGSIAVISLNGPMMKEDNCGDAGTASIAQQIKDASASPNIDGIILKIDSPGGSVDGTETLANTYASVTNIPKITFVDGMMCSAAMWAGSPGDEVWASGETDIIGSIGTMMSFQDLQPVYEKMGMKFHNIYADGSHDKNKMFTEAKAGNYEPIKNEMLNPTNKVFTAAIQKNRAGKIDLEKENVLTGKTYLSAKAQKAGLIDKVGTMEQAVRRVSKMARDKKAGMNNELAINQNNDIMKVKFLATLTALGAFFGFTKAEGSEHFEGEVTAEKWAELNAKHLTVTALEAKVAEQEAAAVIATTALADANAALEAMTAKKDGWKAKAKEYGATSGGDGKKTIASTTDTQPGTETKHAIIDAEADHNKEANKMLSSIK
jgi:signal peptide peptidase SppA